MRERLGSLAELILFNEITMPSHCIQLIYERNAAQRDSFPLDVAHKRRILHTERALSAAFSKPALGLQSVVYLSPNLIHLKHPQAVQAAGESNLYVRSHEKIPLQRY